MDHLSELCAAARSFERWGTIFTKSKAGLLLLTKKVVNNPGLAFLSSKCNLFCLQASIMSPLHCPHETWEHGDLKQITVKLTTAFAVSSRVLCFQPTGLMPFVSIQEIATCSFINKYGKSSKPYTVPGTLEIFLFPPISPVSYIISNISNWPWSV